MKITILALHLGYGGIEKYISTIANILNEEHEVEIISTYKTISNPAFTIDEKVKITYLTTELIPNTKEFKDALQKKKVMAILKEGIKAFKILKIKDRVNREAIKNCNSDVLISTRDYHNEMIQKYAKEGIIKITTEHNHPCGDRKYIKRIVDSCKGFDYLLPISKELTEFYKKLLPEVNVKYIPIYIDRVEPYVQPTFKKPIYISVGRLSEEKGVLDLLDVFRKIHDKQSTSILHIVGDGNLMDELKKKIEYLDLRNNVIVHGFLNKDKINELYSQSSLYLMTSYTESFGLVLLEAMACGLPCIAFDSAQGATEIIVNDGNGYLIENRDQKKFVDCAISLFEHKKKIMKMSKKAQETLNIYSYENTRQQWLGLMDTIKDV